MMMLNNKYKEQLDRIDRLFKKLKDFDVVTDENYNDGADACTSFFIQCYHLRDWLIKSGLSRKIVDDYIKSRSCLAICHDLANKQKHKDIDRYIPENDFVDFNIGIATPISRYYDVTKNKNRIGIDAWNFKMPLDAIEVANQCIKDWSSLIEINLKTLYE